MQRGRRHAHISRSKQPAARAPDDDQLMPHRFLGLIGAIGITVIVGIVLFLPAHPMVRQVAQARDRIWYYFFPGRPRYTDEHAKSASNLRQIGQGILLYTNEFNGKYPESFDDLLAKEDMTAAVFVSPWDNNTPADGPTTQAMIADFHSAGHCSYIYLGKSFDTHMNLSADVVVCYEPMSINAGWGMNVLFADGHVSWIDGYGGSSIMAQAASGVGPVRWPLPAATMPATHP